MLAFVYEHSFQQFHHLKYHGVEKQTFDLNRILSMEWEYFRAVGLSFIAFDICSDCCDVSCENGIVFSPVNSWSFERPYKCFRNIFRPLLLCLFIINKKKLVRWSTG